MRRIPLPLNIAMAVALAAPAGSSSGAPATAAETPAVEALLQQGEAAYGAGHLEAARDAFAAAVAADARSRRAACDLGIAFLRLGQPAKAAAPLETAAAAKAFDRPLVMALACLYASTKTPMRAVGPILSYFKAHPAAAPDEPMVNALGVLLAQAEGLGVKNALYADAKGAYQKLNASLEATRPGEKRWGVEWVPATEAAQRQATLAAAKLTVKNRTATLRTMDAQIADLRRQLQAVPHTRGNNNLTQKQAAIQAQIDQAVAARDRVQTELDAAQKTVADTQPHWPAGVPADALALPAADGAP